MSDGIDSVSVERNWSQAGCPRDLRLEYLAPDDPRLVEASVLRNEILITPFDQPLVVWTDDSQATARLAAFEGERMVGYASLFSDGDESVQRMRQVAVAFEMQRRGVGRELVRELVEECRRRDVRRLWLAARLPAIPFYERLGFVVVGEEYVESAVNLPHRHMELRSL